MKCANKMCIYQKENICTLEKIEVDWRGNCKNWINARVMADTLNFCKLYTNLLVKNEEDYYFNKDTGEMVHKEEFYENIE